MVRVASSRSLHRSRITSTDRYGQRFGYPLLANPCCDVSGVCVLAVAAALRPVSPSRLTREHVAIVLELTGFFCRVPKRNDVASPDFRSWLFQRGCCRQMLSDLRKGPVRGTAGLLCVAVLRFGCRPTVTFRQRCVKKCWIVEDRYENCSFDSV